MYIVYIYMYLNYKQQAPIPSIKFLFFAHFQQYFLLCSFLTHTIDSLAPPDYMSNLFNIYVIESNNFIHMKYALFTIQAPYIQISLFVTISQHSLLCGLIEISTKLVAFINKYIIFCCCKNIFENHLTWIDFIVWRNKFGCKVLIAPTSYCKFSFISMTCTKKSQNQALSF